MRTLYFKLELTGETEEAYSDVCDELVVADFILHRIEPGDDISIEHISAGEVGDHAAPITSDRSPRCDTCRYFVRIPNVENDSCSNWEKWKRFHPFISTPHVTVTVRSDFSCSDYTPKEEV